MTDDVVGYVVPNPMRPDENLLSDVVDQVRTSGAIDDLVEDVLTTVREMGWRIVRTNPLSGSIFADPRDQIVEITEEWTP